MATDRLQTEFEKNVFPKKGFLVIHRFVKNGGARRREAGESWTGTRFCFSCYREGEVGSFSAARPGRSASTALGSNLVWVACSSASNMTLALRSRNSYRCSNMGARRWDQATARHCVAHPSRVANKRVVGAWHPNHVVFRTCDFFVFIGQPLSLRRHTLIIAETDTNGRCLILTLSPRVSWKDRAWRVMNLKQSVSQRLGGESKDIFMRHLLSAHRPTVLFLNLKTTNNQWMMSPSSTWFCEFSGQMFGARGPQSADLQGARGKRRGFSPEAAACHSQSATAHGSAAVEGNRVTTKYWENFWFFSFSSCGSRNPTHWKTSGVLLRLNSKEKKSSWAGSTQEIKFWKIWVEIVLCEKKKLVEPAQPNFEKKFNSSRLNPNFDKESSRRIYVCAQLRNWQKECGCAVLTCD